MHLTYQHGTLDEADLTLNHLLDLLAEGSWDWNGRCGTVRRSPGWFRMLGYEIGVLQPDVFTWENLIHPEDYPTVMRHIEGFIRGEQPDYCIEYRVRRAEGDYLWIRDRAKVVERFPDGRAARIIGAHLDIQREKLLQYSLQEKDRLLQHGQLRLEQVIREKTQLLEAKNDELKQRIAEIDYYSNTDTLTGIANRKCFEETLNREIARARRYRHALSLAILDIDHFKRINDNHGHNCGDRVLRSVAQLVGSNIRDVDFFARWGGEEFILIFPGLQLEDAARAAEKLRELIEYHAIEPGLGVTASFGLTRFDDDAFDELMRRADEALYRAKSLGRNRVEQLVRTTTVSPS